MYLVYHSLLHSNTFHSVLKIVSINMKSNYSLITDRRPGSSWSACPGAGEVRQVQPAPRPRRRPRPRPLSRNRSPSPATLSFFSPASSVSTAASRSALRAPPAALTVRRPAGASDAQAGPEAESRAALLRGLVLASLGRAAPAPRPPAPAAPPAPPAPRVTPAPTPPAAMLRVKPQPRTKVPCRSDSAERPRL